MHVKIFPSLTSHFCHQLEQREISKPQSQNVLEDFLTSFELLIHNVHLLDTGSTTTPTTEAPWITALRDVLDAVENGTDPR